ncbi:Uncharacterised protein [uncultured archaeon]|nr:Uncharacterised protein [uncultured archaeon]
MVKKKVIEKKEKAVNPKVQEKTKVNDVLVENFVSLQRVMTNLAVKFDNLSRQISKLLELFEISAKTIAEKGYSLENKTDSKVAEKLDSILEQNRLIAKGLALLHEREMDAITGKNEIPSQRYPSPAPIQNMRIPQQYPVQQPRRIMNPEQRVPRADLSGNQRFRSER